MKKDQEEIKVTASVSLECWTELKVLAVRKRVALQDIVREVLEKSMSKKVKSATTSSEETV